MAENNFVNHDGKTLVHIEGPVTIDNVAGIHQLFTNALAKHQSVILDLEKTTDCDGSFIQLVSSLCFTLSQEGQSLELIKNTLPETIGEAINILGFNFRCGCSRRNNIECPFSVCVKNSEQEQEIQA